MERYYPPGIERFLTWTTLLPRMEREKRLDAILRRYPRGVPMEAMQLLMGLSRKRLKAMLNRRLAVGSVVLVHIVNTAQAAIEDPALRATKRADARLRVAALKAEGRQVRQGILDQRLWLLPDHLRTGGET